MSEAYRAHTGNGLSINAVHTVRSRLEKKGMVVSEMRDARQPAVGRLFFAGEAMNTQGHHQTVHRAMETAAGVVREMLEGFNA